jgi:hypothetical protein
MENSEVARRTGAMLNAALGQQDKEVRCGPVEHVTDPDAHCH